MRARAALVALGIAIGGCGGMLADGKAQFDKGRYPEAKQTFAAIEVESRGWSDSKRAEYALYRGLTHAALGDRAAAGIWLKEAKALVDARPGSLSADDMRRLKLGLEGLDDPATP